ncbi:MAG: folylpolyglutamate synthase/dihydrofolate synthase family protein [Candidatus Margulisiibacteriota bacterium]
MSQYPYLDSLEKFGINLGLERIANLLQQLGNPQTKFKSIHIAGTNGKGSTAAMVASILKEDGYKVGLYTSPHLLDYTERIKINGVNIAKREFEKGLRKIKRWPVMAREGRRRLKAGEPTVFEVLTAVAFWYFAKQKVDYAIVEVGMGGRLDATNVIAPLVSVITNIDLEHTEVLGNTLSKIAKEKAGIIKPGVPVVTAEYKAEPLKVIRKTCKEKGCALLEIKKENRREKVDGRKWKLENWKIHLGLPGPHQHSNAACALATIESAKIRVTKRAIQRGLKNTLWPGRFQIIAKKPLVILDGAHNPAGAKTLKVTIDQLYNGQKFTLIFGCQRTKEYQKMLMLLKPIFGQLIVTRSTNAQAAEARKVYQWARKHFDKVYMTNSFSEAFMQYSNASLIITGSLFLVADALKCLDAKAAA